MRALARYARATQRAEPARFGIQQSIEVNTLVRRRAADIGSNSATPGAARALHDFSGIPLHAAVSTGMQPKLNHSTPQDASEQEANRASEQVMSTSEPSLELACTCGAGCPKCRAQQPGRDRDREPSTIRSSGLGQTVVPPIVYEVTRSFGQSLDPALRGFMEARLGHNFGNVRVHADVAAAAAARAVNANAFTWGEHVVFDTGQYAPASEPGKRLLAHELAHVVQQSQAVAPWVARQPKQNSPATPQQDLCSKLNLSALRLPRTDRTGFQYFETTVKGIRFLAAVSAKQAGKIKADTKGIATQIEKLNPLITDTSKKINLVIVAEASSGFRILCGHPVLIIDPGDFSEETGAHEATHGVTDFLLQQLQGSGGKQASVAKNFLNKVADIYLQLQNLTIEVSPGNSLAATNLVDPQTLDPKAKPEHPQQNVDEFLASAVAVFLVSRKVLEQKINEFGKKDPKILKLGKDLVTLLDAVITKQTLPEKQLSINSSAKDIGSEMKRIPATPVIDDSFLDLHAALRELLFPR
jgi:Domain of unknown function (DUF4157)